MAQIIPTSPIGSLPAEVLKAYRFFKSLPDDYFVWHHLTPWEREAPDFLIVSPTRQALLVKVSVTAAKPTHPAAQMLLLGDSKPFGEEEIQILETFRKKLPAALRDKIASAVLFPNVHAKSLSTYKDTNIPHKYHWVGQEMIQSNTLEHWNEMFIGDCLTELMFEQLRSAFSPEIVIPEVLTVRTPDEGRHTAGLKDYLLDIVQEAAVKNDLELPLEQRRASNDFHVGIINGVAGSGKTLILLYRLRLLQSLFPNKKFLVLTHNRPLIRDIRSRYQQLTGGLPRNIAWKTFNGFCRRYWPDKEVPWTDPIGQAERDHLVQTVWEKYFEGTSIHIDRLLSEIDWFKDQIPMNKSKYLQTERKGRGFRLSQEQRLLMWNAISEYQHRLKRMHRMDWGDVPRKMWNFIRERKAQLPVYDFVMIDEAQFFAPIWFEIIRQVTKPRSGHLFIVADPTQGFLGRGTSWKYLGIEARGKTQNIRRSYRTTHEILNFATLLYRHRVQTNDNEDDIIEPDLMNMPHGVIPVLIPLRSGQDEIGKVTAEIEFLKLHGAPLGNILILHSEWEGVDALIASLNHRLGDGTAIDPKDASPGETIRVTTLNAGTGLESPIVFLVGLNRLFEKEQSLRLSDEDIDRLMLENTRKIYMAATRAGQRLVITYVGQIPQVLKDLLVVPE